jgi:hypothetical protein
MGCGPGFSSFRLNSRFAATANPANSGCDHGDNTRNPSESGQKPATISLFGSRSGGGLS